MVSCRLESWSRETPSQPVWTTGLMKFGRDSNPHLHLKGHTRKDMTDYDVPSTLPARVNLFKLGRVTNPPKVTVYTHRNHPLPDSNHPMFQHGDNQLLVFNERRELRPFSASFGWPEGLFIPVASKRLFLTAEPEFILFMIHKSNIINN